MSFQFAQFIVPYLGKRRCYVNLALIYPQEGYRSRATRAFESAMCRVLATEVF